MKFPENIAAIAKILNKAGEKWTLSSKGREVVNFGFYEGSEERTKLFIAARLRRGQGAGRQAHPGHRVRSRLRRPALDGAQHDGRAQGIEITHIAGLTGRVRRRAGASS